MICVRRDSSKSAQVFVLFAISLATIFLLVGLAIDSGLLYLAQARLSRAVDGAALAAMADYNANVATNATDATGYALNVATIARNFATANYSDLSPSDDPLPLPAQSLQTTPTSTDPITYTYDLKSSSFTGTNPSHELIVNIGFGSDGVTPTSVSVQGNSNAPAFFMPFFGPFFPGGNNFGHDMVHANASSTRNPRLIVIVIDRSGSMAVPNGGSYGLADAVSNFLASFDPGNDSVGMVSFSSNARLEMPINTNFINIGTNILDYTVVGATNTGTPFVSPPDPESISPTPDGYTYDPNYATGGVRRLKFSGCTAADEGFRLGMETLLKDPNFNNVSYHKYLVFFTDGLFNAVRTLVAAPAYTNVVVVPISPGQNPALSSNYVVDNIGTLTVPFMSDPMQLNQALTNNDPQIGSTPPSDFQGNEYANAATAVTAAHTNDYWVSIDPDQESLHVLNQQGVATKNMHKEAVPITRYATTLMAVEQGAMITYGVRASGVTTVTNFVTALDTNGHGIPSEMGSSEPYNIKAWYDTNGSTHYTPEDNNDNYGGPWLGPLGKSSLGEGDVGETNLAHYTTSINAWLSPGSVDYVYDGSGKLTATYISKADDPTLNVNISLVPGGSNVLVVPGYLLDGTLAEDGPFTEPTNPDEAYLGWNQANFAYDVYQWPDSVGVPLNSTMRQMAFRNFPNLLTGYGVFAPYDPPSPLGSAAWNWKNQAANLGVSPEIGLGMYYPSAPMLWCFSGVGFAPYTNATLGYGTNGIEYADDPNNNNQNDSARHLYYSTNMSQEVPLYAGEMFYINQNTPTIITAPAWQQNIPTYLSSTITRTDSDITPIMTNDFNHYSNTNVVGDAWYPRTYNGFPLSLFGGTPNPQDIHNQTGGYVLVTNTTGAGGVPYITNRGAMCFSGRPTHYYDFRTGQWQEIPNQLEHSTISTDNPNGTIPAPDQDFILAMCEWKVNEYATQLRTRNVRIFTVGFGATVNAAQQKFLAQLANATNYTQLEYSITNNFDGSTTTNYVDGYTNRYNPMTPIPDQPVGAEYYEIQPANIAGDFSTIATEIEAYLNN